jgi:predicted nucleic acid-binding protein
MLIYLDGNIVQYCADHKKFITGRSDKCKATEPKLRHQLEGIRRLVELEQLGDWTIACSRHLFTELHRGKPELDQLKVYKMLCEAWSDSVWREDEAPAEDEILATQHSSDGLNLKDKADQRHLAEALALNASWFITNDRDILKKTKGGVNSMRVSRTSECLDDISVGLLLK